jgi:glycine/D-amino acid oxidase-like deaminating enzyme
MDRPDFSELVNRRSTPGDFSTGRRARAPAGLCEALAREAEAAGAVIHEVSEVTRITEGRHVF